MVDVEPGLPPVAVPVPAFVPASRPPQPKAATMATARIQREVEFIESTLSKNKAHRNSVKSGDSLGSLCATDASPIMFSGFGSWGIPAWYELGGGETQSSYPHA
jgi:hypothetical protein